MSERLKVAIVQDFPLPFAVAAGLERALHLTKQAIEQGARLVAFGQHFIGGPPAWLQHLAPAALWDHPGTRELHAMLLKEALREDDARFQQLQWTVDIAGVAVSIGGYERVRNSLFSTQFLFRPKAPVLRHRKLVLSPGEHLMLGTGDGSTMELHGAPWGAVGQLAAGEHWMPLARAAMHHAGEAVHVAAWGGLDDIAMLASAHYAYEGRCFVLAAGSLLTRHDLLHGYARAGGEGAGGKLLGMLPEGMLLHGHSAIFAPDGVVIASGEAAPAIVSAEIDLSEVERGLATMDTDGMHARPDIFELRVDRRVRHGIVDDEAEASASG